MSRPIILALALLLVLSSTAVYGQDDVCPFQVEGTVEFWREVNKIGSTVEVQDADLLEYVETGYALHEVVGEAIAGNATAEDIHLAQLTFDDARQTMRERYWSSSQGMYVSDVESIERWLEMVAPAFNLPGDAVFEDGIWLCQYQLTYEQAKARGVEDECHPGVKVTSESTDLYVMTYLFGHAVRQDFGLEVDYEVYRMCNDPIMSENVSDAFNCPIEYVIEYSGSAMRGFTEYGMSDYDGWYDPS